MYNRPMTDPKPSLRSTLIAHPDREIVDREWIIAFLNQAGMATLATVQGDQPFLSTLLFAYDESANAIYFHTGRRGRVWQNVQTNPLVCLTASVMGRLLPADTALNFSVEYQSVVVFGSAHLVNDPDEACQGLQMILDKYFPHLQPGRDYRPITQEELRATAVYRLDVEEWSAKRKAVREEFPGAIRWRQGG